MTAEEKLKLIKELLEVARVSNKGFEGTIGEVICLVAHAIVTDDPTSFTEGDEDDGASDDVEAFGFGELRSLFPDREHPIWRHVAFAEGENPFDEADWGSFD